MAKTVVALPLPTQHLGTTRAITVHRYGDSAARPKAYVQAGAGVAMVATGIRPTTATHYLYGLTAVLVLPFAWSYLRTRNQRQALLIYSLVALFIFGLAVRGVITGR